MNKNKLIIASAGSWKTTYLVNEALKIKDENVLITTYTEANEEEIRKKIMVINKKWYIPKNITIKTWFSFLLQHWVRPYQSALNDELFDRNIWFYLSEDGSTTTYRWKDGKTYSYSKDKNFFQYFFTSKIWLNICSDTISDFIINCNNKVNNEIIDRISRIFPNIFIDEVQDLAWWDLEIIKLLFKSNSNILLVWDPRQVTYLTHQSLKYKKYKNWKIENFLNDECKKIWFDIDSKNLKNSHRNNKIICDFSSKLFPNFEKTEPCLCIKCHSTLIEHQWIFLIRKKDIGNYCKKYNPNILKWSWSEYPEWNFWKSKWLTFDRVLIYPTTWKNWILEWLKNNQTNLTDETRAKFYVAITRAKYSVWIVYDYGDNEEIDGIDKRENTPDDEIGE